MMPLSSHLWRIFWNVGQRCFKEIDAKKYCDYYILKFLFKFLSHSMGIIQLFEGFHFKF
jgi:hypothetical protein